MSAFENYLLSLTFQDAYSYFWKCLREGGHNNMAWELMGERAPTQDNILEVFAEIQQKDLRGTK